MKPIINIVKSIKPEPIIKLLLKRLSLIFVIYMLCRILFLIINRRFFQIEGIGHLLTLLRGGLLFDMAAIFYVNALYILLQILPFRFRYHKTYQAVSRWIFIVFNSIAVLLNITDIFYYPFTLSRTTASAFKQFAHEKNLSVLLFKFMTDYWYGTILILLFIIALIYLTRKWISNKLPENNGWKYYTHSFIYFVLAGVLFIGGVRGGDFKHSTRPITLSNAGEYIRKPAEMSIVLNTPFCIIRTFGKKSFEIQNFFADDAKLSAIYTPVHPARTDSIPFTKKNVVVIMLESFGKEFFGFFNKSLDQGNYKGYTPFLDSLFEHSLTFNYSFANGRKSIDVMPSVLVGIPSMVEPYVTTENYRNVLKGLPQLLEEEGYRTAFFHGAPNGSMGYLAFSNVLDIDGYYGMNEYGNNADFDGYWGIWDEEFFQYFAKEVSSFKEPFNANIFSVSSHHPFLLPERYKGKFPEGPHPLYRCIGYTDYALQKFFASAQKEAWFKNTIFVITADHCQTSPTHDIYYSQTGSFEVPIIFYSPGDSLKGRSDQLIQQIDIMPTILGLLKYPKPYFAFGNDVLNNGQKHFLTNYIDGTYQIFYGDHVLQFNGKKTTGIYNFKTDRTLKIDLTGKIGTLQDTMENQAKAFIQQYHNRMVENRLTIGK